MKGEAMQIIWQKRDGSRVHLTQAQYDTIVLRYGKKVSHIVRDKKLTIACLKGNETARPNEPRLKYGGGDRQRNPFNYTKAGCREMKAFDPYVER